MKKQNELTAEQKAFLEQNFRGMREKELFEKLSALGPEVDVKAFEKSLRSIAKKTEDGVFSQNVSEEELLRTNGGRNDGGATEGCPSNASEHCIDSNFRHIYEGGFPNCAATVEDGSWCGTNDACLMVAVVYMDKKDCQKAWR